MKRLFRFTLGLIVAYVIIRLLMEYFRPVRVKLDTPAEPPSPFPQPPPSEPPSPQDMALGRVNPNKADVTTLVTLSGIGPALAKRIIAYRQEIGPFADLEDLKEVRGIGPALLEQLRPQIDLT